MRTVCPKCLSSVAAEATACPYCGFTDGDEHRAIATLPSGAPSPAAWDASAPFVDWEPVRTSPDFRELFLDASNLLRTVPDIGEWLRAHSSKTHLVADINTSTQRLIDEGKLIFQLDKNGDILPTLIDGNKKYGKKIRLKEVDVAPELAGARSNLAIQIALNQVLTELETLQSEVSAITEGLQDDRLALIESAWDQFLQARSITSARLREARLIEAQTRAIDGRRQLTASARRDAEFLAGKLSLGRVDTIKAAADPRSTARNAETAERFFVALDQIVRAAEIEATTYVALGEPDAARTALGQFLDTIQALGLNDRETMLRLNGFTEHDMQSVVDHIITVRADTTALLDTRTQQLLSDETQPGYDAPLPGTTFPIDASSATDDQHEPRESGHGEA